MNFASAEPPIASAVSSVIRKNSFSAKSLTSGSKVLTVPFILTSCGITLNAVEDVSNEVMETTTCSTGSDLREAIV